MRHSRVVGPGAPPLPEAPPPRARLAEYLGDHINVFVKTFKVTNQSHPRENRETADYWRGADLPLDANPARAETVARGKGRKEGEGGAAALPPRCGGPWSWAARSTGQTCAGGGK